MINPRVNPNKKRLETHWILLTCLLVGAFFLRFNPVMLRSFKATDAANIYVSMHSIMDILRFNAQDQSPGYYIFLHYWMKFFGVHEIITRIPSVIFSWLSIIYLYKTLKNVADKKTALLACLFMSVSSSAVYTASLVKHWSLFLLFISMSLYYFVQYIQNAKAKDLWLLSLISILNIYTCFYAGYYVAVLYGFLFLIIYKSKSGETSNHRDRNKRLISLALSIAAISVLIAPQLLQVMQAIRFSSGSAATVPDYVRNSLATVTMMVRALVGELEGPLRYPIAFWGIYAVFALGLIRLKKSELMFIFLWIVPFLSINYILSEKSEIHARYFVGMMPVTYWVLAKGVIQLPTKWLKVVSCTLIVFLMLTSLSTIYRRVPKEGWREAVAFVEKNYQSGDAIVIRRRNMRRAFDIYSDKPMIVDAGNRINWIYYSHFKRVWIVGPKREDQPYESLLRRRFGSVNVALYDLNPKEESDQHIKGVYNFRAHLDQAKVFQQSVDRKNTIPYSEWKTTTYLIKYEPERGPGGEGLYYDRWEPKQSFFVTEDAWKMVSKNRFKSGGEVRDIIWAHPLKEYILNVEYKNVLMEDFIYGYLGLSDLGVSRGDSPVEFEVNINGERVFYWLKANIAGWKPIVIDTSKWKGQLAAVSIKIFAAKDRWRHFGFNLWTERSFIEEDWNLPS